LKYSADNGYRGIWLYWVLANYSDERDDRPAAIEYLKYVVENDEDASEQISRIGSLSQMEYYDTHIEEYADMAIEYCNRSDEKNGELPATFFDRGYVYSVRGDYERSSQQFLGLIRVVESIEETDANRSYHIRLRGTAYEVIAENHLYLHNFSEAIEYGKTALREFDIPEFYRRAKSIYNTIYQAYLWSGDADGGIAFFEKERQRFSEPDHWKANKAEQSINGENVKSFNHYLRNLWLLKKNRTNVLIAQKKLWGGSLKVDEVPGGFTWDWEKRHADDLFWMAQSFPEYIGDDMKAVLKSAERAWKKYYRRDRLYFDKEANYVQLTETKSYINFLILLGQQLTIYGYDDAWAKDILDKAEYAADLLGDRFADRDDLYNWRMWNSFFIGDNEAAASYAEKYVKAVGKVHKYVNDKGLDVFEAIEHDFNHRKAVLFMLAQAAAVTRDTHRLSDLLKRMDECRPCPHCIFKVCYEQKAMEAWLHYLEGDRDKALDTAEECLKLTWDHNCDYAEMLLNRCL
ncbi:MAG: hypothetical protein J6N76_05485, partial [Lachnospiraceae bacterium]|nr:hypothetical protein [Lachnospiraceae bacterium]